MTQRQPVLQHLQEMYYVEDWYSRPEQIAPAWGCPALADGPGDSSLDHTPAEHIALADYQQGVEELKTVLRQFCQHNS
jgi:hypothetical protein